MCTLLTLELYKRVGISELKYEKGLGEMLLRGYSSKKFGKGSSISTTVSIWKGSIFHARCIRKMLIQSNLKRRI